MGDMTHSMLKKPYPRKGKIGGKTDIIMVRRATPREHKSYDVHAMGEFTKTIEETYERFLSEHYSEKYSHTPILRYQIHKMAQQLRALQHCVGKTALITVLLR